MNRENTRLDLCEKCWILLARGKADAVVRCAFEMSGGCEELAEYAHIENGSQRFYCRNHYSQFYAAVQLARDGAEVVKKPTVFPADMPSTAEAVMIDWARALGEGEIWRWGFKSYEYLPNRTRGIVRKVGKA